jgi:hypothetical protein
VPKQYTVVSSGGQYVHLARCSLCYKMNDSSSGNLSFKDRVVRSIDLHSVGGTIALEEIKKPSPSGVVPEWFALRKSTGRQHRNVWAGLRFSRLGAVRKLEAAVAVDSRLRYMPYSESTLFRFGLSPAKDQLLGVALNDLNTVDDMLRFNHRTVEIPVFGWR